MDKILFSNSFKNLMVALGAKTSDSSYAVPLINKTSGAPQGYMEMSALAQVLGELDTFHGDGFYSSKFYDYAFARPHSCAAYQSNVGTSVTIPNTFFGGGTGGRCSIFLVSQNTCTPSIFVLGRKTVVATIYDGNAIHQSDLAFNSDGSLTITKRAGLALYFRVLVMEW